MKCTLLNSFRRGLVQRIQTIYLICHLWAGLMKNITCIRFVHISCLTHAYYILYTLHGILSMQILPLFSKYSVIHFNKTDARLANNGISTQLQLLRCRVNFHALKFTPQIEALGNKLVQKLQAKGSFVALHLRYEMDMLAFSGCNHGLSQEEAEELKRMRSKAILCSYIYINKYQNVAFQILTQVVPCI